MVRRITKVKSVNIRAHPEFFKRMELERKEIESKLGISLGQKQLTKIFATAKIPKLKGELFKDVKQKRRRN